MKIPVVIRILIPTLATFACASAMFIRPTQSPSDTSHAVQLLNKRADQNDIADIGYATLSGVSGDDPKIVIVDGVITAPLLGTLLGNIEIGSNTSLLGKGGATLRGVRLSISNKNNVIIRNLISIRNPNSLDLELTLLGAPTLQIRQSQNIWVDSCEFYSPPDSGPPFGSFIEVSRGTDWVTILNTHFHDGRSAIIVGHSDNNGAEDSGHLTVTIALNKFALRVGPVISYRFGKGHIYNNYFLRITDGISTRQGAELLVQNNVFELGSAPELRVLYSADRDGFANASGNDFGGGGNAAPFTPWDSVGYSYMLTATSSVKSYVNANAGAKLSF